jgi:SHS2 domain-containing protein
MGFRVLPHTADVGIEATASSFSDLVAELARGMFAIMGTPTTGSRSGSVVIDMEAESAGELVVDVLSELLYRSEAGDLFLTEFAAEGSPGTVRMKAGGVGMGNVEETGPPVKAVTYHGLVVEQRPKGWYGRVYFDV